MRVLLTIAALLVAVQATECWANNNTTTPAVQRSLGNCVAWSVDQDDNPVTSCCLASVDANTGPKIRDALQNEFGPNDCFSNLLTLFCHNLCGNDQTEITTRAGRDLDAVQTLYMSDDVAQDIYDSCECRENPLGQEYGSLYPTPAEFFVFVSELTIQGQIIDNDSPNLDFAIASGATTALERNVTVPEFTDDCSTGASATLAASVMAVIMAIAVATFSEASVF